MMVSFDTNILVYATSSHPKAIRARDVLARSMRIESSILLLQVLAEFSNVAIRKAGIPVEQVRTTTEAWRAVFPVQKAEVEDLSAALDAIRSHHLSFWDAMLWATARRAGVRYLLTEDLQDGFDLDGVCFINPFTAKNDDLLDTILRP
jgi:predicted nucleic acid-binding protein